MALKKASLSPLAVMGVVIQRDISLALRQGGIAALTLGFFLVALSLYPFGLGSDPALLARTGPALIWITALFATLLSLDRMFQSDLEDGTLVQYALSPLSPFLIVIAKILAHWVAILMPLVLISPLASLLFNLPISVTWSLFLTLLIGTPALSLLGAMGASLTVAVKRGGALITLILLPLYVPTLIFALGVIEAARLTLDPAPAFLYLTLTTLVAACVAPLFARLAFRAALE